MYLLKDIYTDQKRIFPTIYQISRYFYDSGISKTIKSDSYLKKNIKIGRVVYKHYLLLEIPTNDQKD